MALDSYRVRETKPIEEKKEMSHQEWMDTMKDFNEMLTELENDTKEVNPTTTDIDQQWVRENEANEVMSMQTKQRVEETLAHLTSLEKFAKAREKNNLLREEYRDKQLSSMSLSDISMTF